MVKVANDERQDDMSGKKMRVYYDFEFLEEYGTVDPISVGFVREDGRELYIVFNDFNTLAVANNTWLMENVMSSIGHTEITSHVTGLGTPVKDLIVTDEAAMPKWDARRSILEYVDDIRPEFWAWYSAYDHVALCSLFGRMVDIPADFPYSTLDIKQLHKQAGSPELPKQPPGKHNALEDARHNVVRYNYLVKYLKGRTYVIADTKAQGEEWADAHVHVDDEYRVITDSDELRGVQISKSRDKIVWLTESYKQTLHVAVDLSRRLP